ncbi:MAG: flagellar biosynthesis protein FlhF, partial [Chloroflexi bacterium]|nr:flagellar biosynthesis protein FlhF [Chloroflexota bacterium]
MFTKTFRAASMSEVLAKVQTDLGPDALVLASHKVMDAPVWQVWREPEVEVLAMPAHAPPTPAPSLAKDSDS